MKNENNSSIYDFLKKLEIRLANFTKNQHYAICIYMKGDIENRDKAININNEITMHFKNIQKKYFKYLENKGTQSFEKITSEEFNAYSFALNEENKSLENINFKSLGSSGIDFSKYKNIILQEIEDNIKNHSEFMIMIRK